MEAVTVRDLRNHGGDVLTRVSRGEALIVTRDGAEVAELHPRRRATLSSADLISRRRGLPSVDTQQFEADVDSVLDSTI